MSTSDVSLRVVIDAKRRLDELGTARLLGEIAETVHKTQKQGQPIGRLAPEAVVVRDGAIVLELPAAPVAMYRAPELRGGAGDRRSDVFSLGVMLWEALAHVPLFASEAEVLSKHVPPVSEFNANVPAELDAICKKALARDPVDRYQSAKVMAAEISAVLDDAGYPEGLDEITKWIAREAPRGGSGTQPPPSVTRPPFNPGTTAVGMAPVRIDDKTMPLQPVDLVEVKAAPQPIQRDDSSPHVLPAWAKPATIPPPIAQAPKPSSPIASAPTVGVPAMPAPLATVPAAPLAAAAAAVQPAPMPPAANPAPIQGAAPMPPKVAAPVVVAASTPVAAAKSAPVPAAPVIAAPTPAPVPAAPVLPPALAAAAPLLATAAPTQTLTGVSSAQLLPAKLLSKPPVDEPPASKPPVDEPPRVLTSPAPLTTAPGVAMPAVAPAPAAIATPIVSAPIVPAAPILPAAPVLKLPDAPPGATVSANSPPVFATTAIAGSGALSGPTVAPEPAKYDGTRTAILGSNAIIEATNAAVSAANPPVQVPAPTPLVVPKSELPIPFKPKPGISNAVTVSTDQLRDTIKDPVKDTLETPSPSQPVVAVAVEAPASRAAESEVAKSVNVVSVRSQRGDPSRSDKTGKGDVLAGWGWGTDSHQAYEDDAYEDDGKKTKKRLVLAIGGALGVVLIVTVVAFAMGGGGTKDQKPEDVVAKPQVEPAVNTEPPKQPEPPKQEPVTQDPPPVAAVDPPVANEPDPKTDPKQDVKTDPATDPKVDVAKDPKTDPKALAKTDPKLDPKALAKPDPKPDPKKVVKQEPKKDPVAIKKPDPKKVKKDPVAIKKPTPKKDPVVKTEPKVDASAAYKTGLRQMAGGDSNGALATFKASLASDPGFAPTWRGIGMVYEKLGKKSQATTAFRRYLQLSPNAGDAEQIRARLEKLGS